MWVVSFPLYAEGIIYHAGDPVIQLASPRVLPRREVTLSGSWSLRPVEDKSQERFLRSQRALSLRGIYYLNNWFGVGAEGTLFEPEHFTAVRNYRRQQAGIVLKALLTPDTSPEFYAVAGAGHEWRRIQYDILGGGTEHTGGSYVMAGMGVETTFGWFITALEGTVKLHDTDTLGMYFSLPGGTELAVALRCGVRW